MLKLKSRNAKKSTCSECRIIKRFSCKLIYINNKIIKKQTIRKTFVKIQIGWMFIKSYFDYKKNWVEFRQFTVNSFANK